MKGTGSAYFLRDAPAFATRPGLRGGLAAGRAVFPAGLAAFAALAGVAGLAALTGFFGFGSGAAGFAAARTAVLDADVS